MKHWSIGLVLFAFVLSSCNDGTVPAAKVPSVVKNTFEEAYGTNSKVEWKKKAQVYEAEAELGDNKELKMQIDNTGKLLQQKADLSFTELPPAVQVYITESFAAYNIDEVEAVQKGNRQYYQLELDGQGKDRRLVLTADGREENMLAYWD